MSNSIKAGYQAGQVIAKRSKLSMSLSTITNEADWATAGHDKPQALPAIIEIDAALSQPHIQLAICCIPRHSNV